jgi:hypothetical protein
MEPGYPFPARIDAPQLFRSMLKDKPALYFLAMVAHSHDFSNAGMTQAERARRYSQLAYSSALGEIVREFNEKRRPVRARLADCDVAKSIAMIQENAKLDGEQIAATIKAQLNTLLDGYELNDVRIDDDLASTIASEVGHSLEAAIARSCVRPPGARRWAALLKFEYPQYVSQYVGISPAWIRAEIDRRRFIKQRRFWRKRQADLSNMYHVDGDAPRVSADNSVSALIKANLQLFVNLRQKIEWCLQEGYERTVMLEKLTVFEQAQDLRSFAKGYADFISAAANHIFLLTPFAPALTEMLHKALRCDGGDCAHR